MTKSKKTIETNIIDRKVTFEKATPYVVELPTNLKYSLNEGSELVAGQMINDVNDSTEIEIQKIAFIGDVKVNQGDKIQKGDDIAAKKGFLGRSKLTKAPVGGTVKEIADDFILIEVDPNSEVSEETDTDESNSNPLLKNTNDCDEIYIQFDSTVKSILKNALVIEFPAVHLNLFKSKGGSFTGPIRYLSKSVLKDRAQIPSDLNGSIVLTEQLTPELYPMLSSMGVGAIVANSIDASLYKNIVILTIPIGIISGFGSTVEYSAKQSKSKEPSTSEVQPEMICDGALFKYLLSKEKNIVWLDAENGRFVVPEEKEPYALKSNKFDLTELGVLG